MQGPMGFLLKQEPSCKRKLCHTQAIWSDTSKYIAAILHAPYEPYTPEEDSQPHVLELVSSTLQIYIQACITKYLQMTVNFQCTIQDV